MTSHIYWRLRARYATNVSYELLKVFSLQMRSTTSGANLCVGGTEIGMSYGGSYTPAKAFDNDPATYWNYDYHTTDIWLGYQFASEQYIADIHLDISQQFYAKNYDGWFNESPANWTFYFESSDDGNAWTTEKTWVGATDYAGGAGWTIVGNLYSADIVIAVIPPDAFIAATTITATPDAVFGVVYPVIAETTIAVAADVVVGTVIYPVIADTLITVSPESLVISLLPNNLLAVLKAKFRRDITVTPGLQKIRRDIAVSDFSVQKIRRDIAAVRFETQKIRRDIEVIPAPPLKTLPIYKFIPDPVNPGGFIAVIDDDVPRVEVAIASLVISAKNGTRLT